MLLPNAAWAQTKLTGTVGPGFTISLRDATGANVTRLPVGAYEITVDDLGIEHNFHLRGPGVDMFTEVEQVEVVLDAQVVDRDLVGADRQPRDVQIGRAHV